MPCEPVAIHVPTKESYSLMICIGPSSFESQVYIVQEQTTSSTHLKESVRTLETMSIEFRVEINFCIPIV